MTAIERGDGATPGRLSPADIDSVRFARAGLLHGYRETQVNAFLDMVKDEVKRLIAEKAELRDQVHALQEQLESGAIAIRENPNAHAVRILSSAQQTADQYVADAEEYSRLLTTEARERYEEVLREAQEHAEELRRKAELEAATSMGGGRHRTVEDLQAQVVYLQAFGQAFRSQLKSYLEALLVDIETEWDRTDPGSVAEGTRTNGHPGLVPPRLGAPSGRQNGNGAGAAESVARDQVIELPR